MRDQAVWLLHRAGRRGAFLGFLAILFIGYGYSLLTTPLRQRVFDLLLSWEIWGWIWIIVGIICAVRVFGIRDRIAFTAAALLTSSWALLAVDMWLFQHVPREWVAVVIWTAFSLIVYVVAGWPDPVRTILPEIVPPSEP